MERRELTDEYDIEVLIDVFYAKVLRHPNLSVYFSHAVKNWDFHKTRFVQFWSSRLLFTESYDGGTLLPQHVAIDAQFDHSFNKGLFDDWAQLWVETVNELFIGEKAKLAIETGEHMAKNIYLKMFFNRKPKDYGVTS